MFVANPCVLLDCTAESNNRLMIYPGDLSDTCRCFAHCGLAVDAAFAGNYYVGCPYSVLKMSFTDNKIYSGL